MAWLPIQCWNIVGLTQGPDEINFSHRMNSWDSKTIKPHDLTIMRNKASCNSFAGILLLALCILSATPNTTRSKEATSSKALVVLPGFDVELLHSATSNEGSWICMTVDDKGRLIVSPQSDKQRLLRFTLASNGQIDQIETIPAPVRQAMGLCYAHDSLYVNGHGPEGTGLYRLVDANRNDRFDTNEVQFLKRFRGEGEHGYHAVVEGPDGMMYVMNGNHTKIPEGVASDSPHTNYQEDILLPRQWDANGHAAGVLAPGGHVLRTDPDGRHWELLLAGFRNAYDFDFNPDGEMFTFDSDMEWDWGLPWFRPTRISHCVSAAEFGWRSGSGKWPDSHADSLPAVVDIGIGSPSGVKFGTQSNFPETYRRALFAMDWSYGRIFAVHLKPEGASYSGDYEEFLKGKPLNVTDLEFGRDGAMYFITGGRGTQSGLYRVSYVGDDVDKQGPSTRSESETIAAASRALRHELESFHGKEDPRAINFAWPHLASPDRFIRYAARIAIEWQDVALWQDRALGETNTQAGLTALLALARCGDRESQEGLLLALKQFPLPSLSEPQQLEKLRVIELSFIRQGRPTPESAKLALEQLNSQYPSPLEPVNRELVQLLIYLNAPDVISRTLDLLAKAPTQEEQIHYAFHLRNLKSGWTIDQRKQYFEWFVDVKQPDQLHPPQLVEWFKEAGRDYSNGSSFSKYLVNIRKDALATLTESELTAVQPLLEEREDTSPQKPAKERKFVKEWRMGDIEPLLGQVASNRDFESGKAAFNDAQCFTCHRFGNEGGAVGPELAGAGSKYSRLDILESLLEPSKVVSDQYQNFIIVKKDGEDVVGRLTDENSDRIIMMPSMLTPEATVEIPLAEITSRQPSKVSPMPTGLLNHLTRAEILDLLAFIETAGKARAVNFQKQAAAK